jgi:gamma-glutamylcyclotransferase (GGCT)/AIG2-like uncharacterized protein YtfP
MLLLPAPRACLYHPSMRLFVYGSLLNRKILANRGGQPSLALRLAPARLRGFARVPAREGGFPTLVPARGTEVSGALVSVSAAALARLVAYEGSAYRLIPMRPEGPQGLVAASAFVAPPRARSAAHRRS